MWQLPLANKRSAAEITAGVVPTNYIYPEPNVLRYGADPTGANDSTTAITNAVKVSSEAYLPAGTYKCNAATFLSLTGFHIYGDGLQLTTVNFAATGTLWTFSGCNFGLVEDIHFEQSASGTTAILCTSATNNVEVNRCAFYNFQGPAVQHTGTSDTPLSGNKLRNSYLLGCATTGSLGQLAMSWSNDYFIEDNEIGVTQQSAPWPVAGMTLSNCSNGFRARNYIWQQTVGCADSSCNYSRIELNRFEESQQQGYTCTGGTDVQVIDNWFNANGLETVNTYDTIVFNGVSRGIVIGNIVYDWTGTDNHRYSFSFLGGCPQFTVKSNRCQGFASAPFNFDSSEPFEAWNFDGQLRGSTNGTVASNTVTYIGASGNSATEADVRMPLPSSVYVVRIGGASAADPTGSDTYTYTAMFNGVAQSLSCQTTAGLFSSASMASPFAATYLSVADVKLVTSATATVTTHVIALDYLEY